MWRFRSPASRGQPVFLFEQQGLLGASPVGGWDLSPDGQRFLMIKVQESNPQPVTEMILVRNWFEEVKQRSPSGK